MTDDPTQRHDLPADPSVPIWPNSPVTHSAADPASQSIDPITPTSTYPTSPASATVEGYSPIPDARPEWTRSMDGAVPPTPER